MNKKKFCCAKYERRYSEMTLAGIIPENWEVTLNNESQTQYQNLSTVMSENGRVESGMVHHI